MWKSLGAAVLLGLPQIASADVFKDADARQAIITAAEKHNCEITDELIDSLLPDLEISRREADLLVNRMRDQRLVSAVGSPGKMRVLTTYCLP